jgi:RNA polymerase sigma factor (sigma-70 family)
MEKLETLGQGGRKVAAGAKNAVRGALENSCEAQVISSQRLKKKSNFNQKERRSRGVRRSQFGAGVATWRPPAWQPIAEQRTMDEQVCNDFERFQRGELGFEKVWSQIEGLVSKRVLAGLRKFLVKGHKTADDLAAHDDIVQEVCLKLQQLPGRPQAWFDRARSGRGPAGLSGWLGQICHNEVVIYCRLWRGAGRKLKQESFEDLQLNNIVGRGSNDREPLSAQQMLEQAELMAILDDCLASLPRQHREAIDLRFFEQLTDRDAGRKIGTAPSTITKRAKAAIAQLRTLLGEQGAEFKGGKA